MKTMETTCVSNELCRLKEEEEEEGERQILSFRRFAYKACTVSVKHTNS